MVNSNSNLIKLIKKSLLCIHNFINDKDSSYDIYYYFKKIIKIKNNLNFI